MSEKTHENLEQLFRKYGFARPEQAAEDCLEAEQLLRDHPGARPDEQLLSGIKAQIAAKLDRQKSFRIAVYKVVAVAAVFVIVTTVMLKTFHRQPDFQPEEAAATAEIAWDFESKMNEDAEIKVLRTEIEQLEYEISALEQAEYNGDNTTLNEIESEFIEICSDFWKG